MRNPSHSGLATIDLLSIELNCVTCLSYIRHSASTINCEQSNVLQLASRIATAIYIGEVSCLSLCCPFYVLTVAVSETLFVPPLSSPPTFAGFSFLIIYLLIWAALAGASFALLIANGLVTWLLTFFILCYFGVRFQTEVHGNFALREIRSVCLLAQAISAIRHTVRCDNHILHPALFKRNAVTEPNPSLVKWERIVAPRSWLVTVRIWLSALMGYLKVKRDDHEPSRYAIVIAMMQSNTAWMRSINSFDCSFTAVASSDGNAFNDLIAAVA